MLVNELVAGGLGHLLCIPTPPIAIVEVSEPFFAAPANANLRTAYNPPVNVGPHFGSQRLRDVYDSAPVTVLPKCVNLHAFPDVVVFDVWTLNADRKMEHCLIVRPQHHPTGYHISSVDHGHCFGGPAWSTDIVNRVGTWQPCCVPEMVQLIEGAHPFDPPLTRLEAITEAEVETVLGDVPAEWGLPPQERAALKAFVLGQKEQVRQILERNRNIFPRWVGVNP